MSGATLRLERAARSRRRQLRAASIDIVRRRSMLPLLLILTLSPSPAPAQTPPPPPRAASAPSPGEYVVELAVRERWLHRLQSPTTTPFIERTHVITIDSIAASGNDSVRDYFVRAADWQRDIHHGHIRRSGTAIPVVDGEWSPTDPLPWPVDSKLVRLMPLSMVVAGQTAAASLSLYRDALQDLVPTFRPPALRPGASWRDTIRWRATRDSLVQEMEGVRVSWLEQDSSANGHLRWLVRDSASVTYSARFELPEYYRDANPVVRQRARGTIIGRALIDVALQLPVWRRDSSAWSGTATLHEEGAVPVSTPARYERIREWRGNEPATYQAKRLKGLREAAERRRQRRISASDPPSTNVDPSPRRLDSSVVVASLGARGDVRAYGGRRLTLDDMRIFVDWVENPQKRWDYGVPLRVLEEMITEPAMHAPMATRDTAAWPCEPQACALLVTRGTQSSHVVLRDLALLAAFSMQPAEWAGRVRARSASEHTMFVAALQQLDGVGAIWDASSKSKVPAPGNGWRSWLTWMSGGNPAPAIPPSPPTGGEPAISPPRFESSHRDALLINAMVTGRDFGRELQLAMRDAREDSARLVYGTVLQHLRDTLAAPDSVLAWFASGSRPLQALARGETRLASDREMRRLFNGTAGDTVAPALRDSLLTAWIVTEIEEGTLFPPIEWIVDSLRGVERLLQGRIRRPSAPDTATRWLLASDWPRGLPPGMPARYRLVRQDSVEALGRAGEFVLLRVTRSARVGPYVVLAISLARRTSGPSSETESPYSTGSIMLVQYRGRWVEVGRSR